MLTKTHVTHVFIGFANKYLVCSKCNQKVTYWHNKERCGCNDPYFNYPCTCEADVTSTCPSWGPVDGCTCTPSCK